MGRFDTSGVLGIRNQRGDHLVQWIAIGCGVHNCHVMTMIRRATVMGDPSIGRSIARRSKQPRVLLLQHADSTVPKLVGEGVNSRTTQPLKAPPVACHREGTTRLPQGRDHLGVRGADRVTSSR